MPRSETSGVYHADGIDVQPESSDTHPHPLNPLIGRVLGGRYEILGVLGTGGMATVFSAVDRRLGRVVAVKVLHQQIADDQGFVKRFHREAEFAASLSSHPHIVSIHDVGDVGDLHFIVMELVDGRNLKEIVLTEGPLGVDRAFHIGRQVASALAFAHQRGLVHRDVKPHNILVGPDDEVKVTDFGIAREEDATQITRPGVMLGTAQYISPEQAMGKPPGPVSDVYSLGVVLFEMLTGRLPFRADNPLALAMQHVQDPPPSPDQLNPAISPAASAIVLRVLAKTPSDRYRSASELEQALRLPDTDDTGSATAYRPLVRETAPAPAPPVSREPSIPAVHWIRRALIPLVLALLALAAWLGSGLRSGAGGTIITTPIPARATASRPLVVPVASTSTPQPTATASPTVTATPTPQATATSAPTLPPSPTLLPSPTVLPTPQPTATPQIVVPQAPVQAPPPPPDQAKQGEHGKDNKPSDKGHGNGDGGGQGDGNGGGQGDG